MPDLLLEIGTEEIPAGFMTPAMENMSAIAVKMLAANHIGHGDISTVGTPRRLVLHVRELAESQKMQSREVMGPSRQAAFDEKGSPTKACEGFARAQGVEIGSLSVKQTPKGEYVFAVREEGGRQTKEILPEMIPELISSIPFPKSMRWDDKAVRFARPIRWLLAIYDGEVVPFEYAGLSSSNLSRGHRFLAPGSFTVADPENYFRRIRGAKVVVDHNLRKKMIAEALAREAEANGGKLLDDPELLDTVNFLVEFPAVTCGRFDEEYLKLPPDVLITSMRSHQKYFSVVDESGALKPLFLTVNNIVTDDMDILRRGNERVLSARLADARFFYLEDLKEALSDKVEELRKVVYQEKLGTSYEKVTRFSALASYLSEQYGLGDTESVKRAAMLSKADLVTEMVGEFPDLQGIIGKYYARATGETDVVSNAIYEHYLPRFAGDDLPDSGEGMAVSLADKMDTIVGSFGIGNKPTGSEDPYGLRRFTLGIINIIFARNLEIDLPDFIGRAVDELAGKIDNSPEEVKAGVLEFFRARLQNLLVQEGNRYDLVDAVISSGTDNLIDLRQRLVAVDEFRSRDEFEPLTIAFKRVMNIIPEGFEGEVKSGLFEEEAEKALYNIYKEKEKGIRDLKSKRSYRDVLVELSSIRPVVDRFFDDVMVMVEDASLRDNRLALMSGLASLFAEVADFTKIVV